MFKGMSNKEQVLYFRLGGEDQRVFSIADIKRILGTSKPASRNIASSLVRKGAAERIKPGLFVRIPESVILSGDRYREDPILIASSLVKEHYLSHLTAMRIHGISNAYTRTVYITTHIHQRDLTYHDVDIRFVHIDKERMFGMSEVEYFRKKITVSDIERTIIDIIDRPNLSGGWYEVISSLKNIRSIDMDRLVGYLGSFKKRKTARITGFLIQRIMENGEVPIRSIMEISGKSRFYMDKNMKGRLIKNWDLMVPEMVLNEIDGQ